MTSKDQALKLYKQGISNLDGGAYGQSLGLLLEAFALLPNHPDIQRGVLRVLSCTSGYQLPAIISKLLLEFAATNKHDLQAYAMVMDNQFEDHEVTLNLEAVLMTGDHNSIKELLESEIFDAFLLDPLFLFSLSRITLISKRIEYILTSLRMFFLQELFQEGGVGGAVFAKYADFLAAQACQSLNTEYIFDTQDDELTLVQALVGLLKESPSLDEPIALTIVGCYTPLFQAFGGLKSDSIKGYELWSALQQYFYDQHISLPQSEQEIARQIPTITPMKNEFSAMMRDQYEQYPYPRWQATRLQDKIAFPDYIRQAYPNVECTIQQPVELLFAGGGTGIQVVQITSGFETKKVLSIDLSKSSLAYAKRKAREFDLNEIEFAQADILELESLNAQFDVIICTGVLHHMRDPQEGLEVLSKILRPGGFMMLALYSTRARRDVVASHAYIKEHSIGDDINGIRQFRQALRSLPEGHKIKSIEKTRDFYSVSGLHDYVFNRHEITYTPLQLQNLLEDQPLNFVGFHFTSGDYVNQYASRFPEDEAQTNLSNWELLDKETPDMFSGMMQFWVQK